MDVPPEVVEGAMRAILVAVVFVLILSLVIYAAAWYSDWLGMRSQRQLELEKARAERVHEERLRLEALEALERARADRDVLRAVAQAHTWQNRAHIVLQMMLAGLAFYLVGLLSYWVLVHRDTGQKGARRR